MNRRHFTSLSAAAAVGACMPDWDALAFQETTAMAAAMQRHQALLSGPRLSIALVPYPGMFLQDLVGPLTMFEALMDRDIHLVWKDTKPIALGPSITVTPTTTFANCPAQLDVLFVPGGVPGTFAMMEDPDVLSFLADRGRSAKYVTSVCTGSLILGAAGLLRGYRATSYWSTREVLSILGAIPTDGRVVVDRNRITGGGVTAGLDFGLTIVAALRSRAYAEAVQLYVEYDPAPPFSAGSPNTAPPASRQFLDDMFGPLVDVARETARRARKRLG